MNRNNTKKDVSGVYLITNNINNKHYVGESVHIYRRFIEHKNYKKDKPLYRSFRKYGIENFTFNVLEEMPGASKDMLRDREYYYKKMYNSYHNGYNQIEGLECGSDSISDDTRKKMSESTMIYTKEEKDEWCTRYINGESSNEISRDIGVPAGTISLEIKRRGLTRTRSEASTKYTKEEKDEWCIRYINGEDTKQIGASLNVHPSVIGLEIKKRGLTRSHSEIMDGLLAGDKNPNFKYTKEEKDEWCIRYINGESANDISKTVEASVAVISREIKKRGLTRSQSEIMKKRFIEDEGYNVTYDQKQKDEWVRLYKSGLSTKDIATITGAGNTTIQREIKKRGVTRGTSKAVVGTNIKTGIEKIYISAAEAGRSLGKPSGNITACCRGIHKSAYGHYWRWDTPEEEKEVDVNDRY